MTGEVESTVERTEGKNSNAKSLYLTIELIKRIEQNYFTAE